MAAIQTVLHDGALDSGARCKINDNFAALNTQLGSLQWVAAPAAANSAGVAGQIAYESGVFYVCVATNTWQKVTIATW